MHSGSAAETASRGQALIGAPRAHVKNTKVVMVRAILASSGTPPFGQRACESLAVSLHFELFFNLHQIDSKNKAIGDSEHARCQKGGVPEEAKIGRTITPFKMNQLKAS